MEQHIIEAIEKAKLLQETVDHLNAEIGKLIDPIIQDACDKDSRAYFLELYRVLPAGAPRSRLLDWHAKRMKDCEYRRQTAPANVEPINPAVRERMTHIQVEAPAINQDAQA